MTPDNRTKCLLLELLPVIAAIKAIPSQDSGDAAAVAPSNLHAVVELRPMLLPTLPSRLS
jgi:hypothetical protein